MSNSNSKSKSSEQIMRPFQNKSNFEIPQETINAWVRALFVEGKLLPLPNKSRKILDKLPYNKL